MNSAGRDDVAVRAFLCDKPFILFLTVRAFYGMM